jgi:hypothetical protein
MLKNELFFMKGLGVSRLVAWQSVLYRQGGVLGIMDAPQLTISTGTLGLGTYIRLFAD